ncbi:MAG: alpha/beta fold hydrolase [Nitrospirota bacterium]
MKILAAIIALTLIPAASFGANNKTAQSKKQSAPQEISVRTPDGWLLRGTYYPGKAGSPLILLMHKLGSNRSEFTGLAKALNARGCNVLAYDARGHGESTMLDGKNVTYESFSDKDFENMTIDIDSVLKYLRQKGVGKGEVGLVGASIQSSTGLIYAAKHPEVKALVLLSPGLSYHNIDTTRPMKEYGARPVFMAASTEDEASYESVKTLEQLAAGPKKTVILTDAGHGAQMFQKDPKLLLQVTDWLSANLK